MSLREDSWSGVNLIYGFHGIDRTQHHHSWRGMVQNQTNVRKSPRICRNKTSSKSGAQVEMFHEKPMTRNCHATLPSKKTKKLSRCSNFYIYKNSCGLDKNLHLILIFSIFLHCFVSTVLEIEYWDFDDAVRTQRRLKRWGSD